MATDKEVDPEAHELYLKGRYFLSQMTREGVDQALGLVQEALVRDAPDSGTSCAE